MPEWVSVAALALAVAATVMVMVQHRRLTRVQSQLEALLTGANEQSVLGALNAQREQLRKLDERVKELVHASQYLHEALQDAIRKVAFERYNPFPGVGGNQSFTFILLDAHNSGIVITSLHNRDATRVYAKAIREGQALQQLSTEEERVLQNALMQKGA